MTSTGTSSFSAPAVDFALEAFSRIGLRPPAVLNEHLVSARMSCNLLQSTWANRGCNLWKVDLQSIPLVQGITTYSIPSDTIMMLDVYLRQYFMSSPVNLTPAFATTLNSPTVTVTQANHGLSVGEYINIIIYTSVGGIILYGFYQVVSVPSVNSYTINAAANATAGTSGGVVPVFTTAALSQTVSVNLPNHGFVPGGTFVVQITTTVGGLTLFGTYTVLSVTDANHFTFTAAYAAGSNAAATENNGQTQIAPQQNTSGFPGYVDRILTPLSRTDYDSIPTKYQQGFPTVFWFDRLINPNVTLWQVPDGNGPYQLYYHRVAQLQDASLQNGLTADIPYRFLEAYCADLAYHLARKWKPELEAIRKTDALAAWAEAAAEDRERVTLNISPDTSEYYR